MRRLGMQSLVAGVILVYAASGWAQDVSPPLADSAVAEESPAASQADQLELSEIVVTARKGKAESLQSVPMAINALGEQEIEQKGITGIASVADMVSGLTFDTGLLPNDTRPTLRGLSTTRGRSNVAILVDYIDVSSEALSTAGGGMTANMRLTDLERIEVVKGPQTVLYGRSAFGGAINYVTKRPSFNGFEGKLDVDASGISGSVLNAHEARGSFSGPITDSVAYRVNLAESRSNGWYENPNTGGDLGDEETYGGAVAIEVKPGGIFSSYSRVEYSHERYGPRAQILRRTIDNTPALGDYVGSAATAQSNLDPGASVNPVNYDNRLGFYNSGQFIRDGSVINAPATFNADGSPQVNCSLDQVPFRNRDPDTGGFAPTGNNAYCRPLLVGSQRASPDEIDLSADPYSGDDFDGTDVVSARLHQELTWDFDGVQLTSLTGYTRNDTRIQEDFDLTDYALFGGERDSSGLFPTISDNSGPAPPLASLNCNGLSRVSDPLIPGSGECIHQFGFDTAMDIKYDLHQFSEELRLAGQHERFDWVASALYWQERLDTRLNDKWWLRRGGSDEVNSNFVSPGASSLVAYDPFGNPTGATGMPYLDANNDGLNDARDCLGGDFGDRSKGCYITARSMDATSPVVDTLSRDTEHFSVAGSLTWRITPSVSWTNEFRWLWEDIVYRGSGSLLHGLSSAFGNCGGFMVAKGLYPIDPADIDGDGSTSEVLNDPVLAGYLIPDIHGQCEPQVNDLPTFSEFVPRTNLTWQVNDDLMAYLTYAEGFKPGGVDTTNASTLALPSDLDHETVSSGEDLNGNGEIDGASDGVGGTVFDPGDRIAGNSKEFQPEYDPEHLKSIEIGAKTQWLDGRITFNPSFFYYKYTDQQLPLLVKVGAGGLVSPTVVNAGESIIKGLEFDFSARITDSWSASLGYTYSDAYFDDFNTRQIAESRFGAGAALLLTGGVTADAGNADGDFAGKQLPFSSKNSWTWGVRYDTYIGDSIGVFADLGGQYQSKRYLSAGNRAYLDGYSIWNLSAGADHDGWSAVLYVDNLFDDDTVRSGLLNTDYGFGVSFEFDLAQAANLVLPQPRTAGLRLAYRF